MTSEGSPHHKQESHSSPEGREIFELLRSQEKESLEIFFGEPVDVPSVPESVTPEQYEKWKEMGFEMHYLPPKEMDQDKEYPGWHSKPASKEGESLPKVKDVKIIRDFQRVYSDDIITLPGKWVLIDGREKPLYVKDGYDLKHEYKDDPLEMAIAKWRGVDPKRRPIGSRFMLTWKELHSAELKDALAKVLGVHPDQFRLPRAIEWNFLGNAYHPEWGDTDTSEWLEDTLYNKDNEWPMRSPLCIGDKQKNNIPHSGLSKLVRPEDAPFADYHFENVGFRPLITLS